ncbi:MAG: fibro-slime domain-containing protein, partial [Fibrobacterales bacterium]
MIFKLDFLGLRLLLLLLLIGAGTLSAQEVIYLYHPWAENQDPAADRYKTIVPHITCNNGVANEAMTPAFAAFGDYWYVFTNDRGGVRDSCYFIIDDKYYGRDGVEGATPINGIYVNSSMIQPNGSTWIRPDFTRYHKSSSHNSWEHHHDETLSTYKEHFIYDPIYVYESPVTSLLVLEATVRDFDHSRYDFQRGAASDGGQRTGCSSSAPTLNMVRYNLGSDRKPIKSSSELCYNSKMDDWFNDSGRNNTTTRNLVLTNNGINFSKDVDGFFPINDFVNGNNYINSYQEFDDNNFHYCMEVHAEFTFKTGDVFNFEGDDDVWVFIDNKRVVDLGGMHQAVSGQADMSGLTNGETYPFDFFYCERQTSGSNMKIETTLNLSQGNTEPEIIDPGAQTVDEDNSLIVPIVISDAETALADLTITVSSNNQTLVPDANLSLNASGTEITIVPIGDENGGPIQITVFVSDGELQASVTFDVTIDPVNDAPSFAMIDTTKINEDHPLDSIELTSVSKGPANENTQIITWTVTKKQADNWYAVVPNVVESGGNYFIEYQVAQNNLGEDTLSVVLEDNGGTASGGIDNYSDSMVLQVSGVNDRPIIVAAGTDNLLEDTTLELSRAILTIQDPDNSLDQMTFKLLGGASYTIGTDSIINPDADFNGTLTVPAVITDAGGLSDTVDLSIEVLPVNDAPSFSVLDTTKIN